MDLTPALFKARPTRSDVIAGISVALVLVPQSLAYADLAGITPATGLVVAAAAGMVAALTASSPVLQSGPVAIASLLTLGALAPIAEPFSDRYLGLAAVLAVLVGLIRAAIGLTRSGALAYLMSEPVLLGFMPGAAVVIILTQINDLAGVEGQGGTTLAAALKVLASPGSWQIPTLVMSMVAMTALMILRRFGPRMPAVLVVVAAAILAVQINWYSGPIVGEMPPLRLSLPSVPQVAELWSLLVPAVIIAIVGFGDVAAISRSYATSGRSRWDADREFTSQGLANLASGLVGGFPVGGSFSRTAIAVGAGAQTAWTAAVAAVGVILVLPAAGLIGQLPQAALAAIIVASVLRLVDIRPMLELRGFSRQQFVIAVTTFVLTLATAPTIQWALVVGIVLSIGAHLRRELLVDVPYEVQGATLHVHPAGVLYFASAHLLVDRCSDLLVDTDTERLVVHLDRLGRVDVTGALALRDLLDDARAAGVKVDVVGATPTSRKIVQRVLSERDIEVRVVHPTDRLPHNGQP